MTALPFVTDRLLIRPWTRAESDVDRVFATYARPEVTRWLGTAPTPLATRDQAYAVVDRFIARTDGLYGVWAVQVRDTGVIAGTVLLVPLPEPTGSGGPGRGEIEVGWHLHPDSWGCGYATESARAVLERGFAAGLDEINAVVRPDNTASLAVCARLGMTSLGRTDRWYGCELEWLRATRTDRSADSQAAAEQ